MIISGKQPGTENMTELNCYLTLEICVFYDCEYLEDEVGSWEARRT